MGIFLFLNSLLNIGHILYNGSIVVKMHRHHLSLPEEEKTYIPKIFLKTVFKSFYIIHTFIILSEEVKPALHGAQQVRVQHLPTASQSVCTLFGSTAQQAEVFGPRTLERNIRDSLVSPPGSILFTISLQYHVVAL